MSETKFKPKNGELYITVTGLNHYFGIAPFPVGAMLSLKKEPKNLYDEDAIKVRVPVMGKVGYVANSPYTVAKGTLSAGRIYALLPKKCAAEVRFVTHSSVIARVYPDKKL